LVAVDNINLDVKSGEVFGFIGPNGAGKTTTIRMFATLLSPTSGTAEIFGHDICHDPHKVRESISMVQQKPYALDWFLTARQNIVLYMKFHGIRERKVLEKRCKRIMEEFDIEENKMQVYRLSGGMQRRVMVARAFACQTPLILLDEPTVGLDPFSKRKTWDFITEASREHGMTIFLTSHNMVEVETLSDRLAIMNEGTIITVDKPDRIAALTGEKVVVIRHAEKKIHDPLIADQVKVLKNRENNLTLGFHDFSAVVETITLITENGISIESINVAEPSLEDVFLQLTMEGVT
jgi:ABC-2 type transport system ATP-binding protein